MGYQLIMIYLLIFNCTNAVSGCVCIKMCYLLTGNVQYAAIKIPPYTSAGFLLSAERSRELRYDDIIFLSLSNGNTECTCSFC